MDLDLSTRLDTTLGFMIMLDADKLACSDMEARGEPPTLLYRTEPELMLRIEGDLDS